VKFKFTFILVICSFLFTSKAFTADTKALTSLYKSGYNSMYHPRYCGRNIEGFLKEAKKRNIDLSNSYVLNIEGGGFLETSGFYTRGKKGERANLGYFHIILLADDMIYDFDMDSPKVLTLNNYVDLQFRPPFEPFKVFGIDYTKNGNPGSWSVEVFDLQDYARGIETTLHKGRLKDFIKNYK